MFEQNKYSVLLCSDIFLNFKFSKLKS